MPPTEWVEKRTTQRLYVTARSGWWSSVCADPGQGVDEGDRLVEVLEGERLLDRAAVDLPAADLAPGGAGSRCRSSRARPRPGNARAEDWSSWTSARPSRRRAPRAARRRADASSRSARTAGRASASRRCPRAASAARRRGRGRRPARRHTRRPRTRARRETVREQRRDEEGETGTTSRNRSSASASLGARIDGCTPSAV